MDFIEHLLHISPDGGSGAIEFLIITAVAATTMSMLVSLRSHFPKSFVEFLEQLGKRDNNGRFDS